MAYPPSFVKPDEASIVEYYSAVGDVGLPVIIQDAPAWTGVPLSVELLARIAEAAPMAATTKVEAPPIAPKVAALVDRGLKAIGGYGALHLLEDLEAGATAFMPGSGLPGLYVELWKSYSAGGVDAAWDLFTRALPALSFQMSSLDCIVAVQKQLLVRAGVFTCDYQRSPTTHMSGAQGKWWRMIEQRCGLTDYVAGSPT